MNTRKLTVAVATTALVVSLPLATVYAGAAVAVGHHSARSAVEVNIGSGVVTAPNICSGAPAIQTKTAAAPYKASPDKAVESDPNAWASRQSSLPFGGAALCV